MAGEAAAGLPPMAGGGGGSTVPLNQYESSPASTYQYSGAPYSPGDAGYYPGQAVG
jgi:hypothetical protein